MKSRIKQIAIEEANKRFESDEVKNILWKNYDSLLSNWDLTLGVEYFKLLKSQDDNIRAFIKDNPLTITGNIVVLNNLINNTTNKWSADLYELYISMTTDFAFNQAEILLPEEFKFTEAEQEQIRRARRRKPRREIITEGFYPMRSQVGVQIPVQDFQYNRNAIQFVNDRLVSTFKG